MWLALCVTMVLGQELPDAGEAEVDAGEVLVDAGAPFDAGLTLDAGLSRETTVTGTRLVDVRRVAGSAQVIGKEELERQETNDLHRVLQGVPGVYVREEDGFGLRPNIGLRGASADRSGKVTMMEDGVLSGPAPYSASAAYYTPMTTRMVGVEVFKGPAAIRFGPQTVGGAINLRTREVPRSLQGDVDVSYGNYNSWKGHGVVGVGTDRYGVLLEGVHLQSDGFKVLDGGGNTGFDKNELMLKGRYETDPSKWAHHEFELKLGYSTERSNETYLGISDADFAKTPQRRYAATAQDQMNWWRTQAVLTHTLTLGERFELVTSIYRQDFFRNWHRFDHFRVGPEVYDLLAFQPAASVHYRDVLAGEADSVGRDQQLILLDNRRRFINQGVQSLAKLTLLNGPVSNELELGVRFHHDEIARRHTGNGYDMVRGTLIWNQEDAEVITDNGAWTRSFSAHVGDTISIGHLLIAPGARLEVFDAGLNDRITGGRVHSVSVVPLLGLGAVYTFDFGLSALAGVNQGFSPPTPGQGEALPERSVNSELGVRYSKHGVRFEAIGFWSEYANLTGECTGSSGCVNDAINRQFNGGAARVLGVEALGSVRAKPGFGVTTVAEISYTFTSARFLTDFQSDNESWGNVVAGAELPYVPQHQGQLRLRASKGPVELGVGAMYYGAMRELAGTGPIDPAVLVPGRLLFDATASVDFGAARIYATATNLSNDSALVSRRPFGARPQAPLLVQVGFKYAFR